MSDSCREYSSIIEGILNNNPDETQELLDRAQRGEQIAFEELFTRHRARLRKAIALRLDRRLSPRVDASDVLQETYLEAAKRLPKYFEQQEMPFYLWLRFIAREKVIALHRRHLGAEKRAVTLEVPLLPADSSAQFVASVLRASPTPSQELAAAEVAERLRTALEQLDQDDRDLIVWRHFERLTSRETAQLLEITEAAASKRYIRALEKLRGLLLNLGVSTAR